jgi:hypothetical protein
MKEAALNFAKAQLLCYLILDDVYAPMLCSVTGRFFPRWAPGQGERTFFVETATGSVQAGQ